MKIDNTRIIWIFGEAFLEKLGKSSGSKSPAVRDAEGLRCPLGKNQTEAFLWRFRVHQILKQFIYLTLIEVKL